MAYYDAGQPSLACFRAEIIVFMSLCAPTCVYEDAKYAIRDSSLDFSLRGHRIKVTELMLPVRHLSR